MPKPIYIDSGILRDLGTVQLECESLKVGTAPGSPRIILSQVGNVPPQNLAGCTLYGDVDPFFSGQTKLFYLTSGGTQIAVTPGEGVLPVGVGNSDGSADGWARVDHGHDGLRSFPVSISANYTYQQTESVIFVNTSGGAVDITLVNPSNPRSFWIKKTSGLNQLQLIPPGITKIEGVNANYVLSALSSPLLGFWTMMFDGTNWWVGA